MRFGQRSGKPGYIGIKRPDHPRAWRNGYVYEHIVVAEAKIGRPLAHNEQVHHINKDTTDNRPENLEVVTPEEHVHRHPKTTVMATLVCPWCRQEFTKPRRKTHLARGGKYPSCCSPHCRGKLSQSQLRSMD